MLKLFLWVKPGHKSEKTELGKKCSYRCVWKVWSGAEQNRAVCWSRQGEDDTRFILESWEDKEGSRQGRKDKERHVRVLCVSSSVEALHYTILSLCKLTLAMVLVTCDREKDKGHRWHNLKGESAQMTQDQACNGKVWISAPYWCNDRLVESESVEICTHLAGLCSLCLEYCSDLKLYL